MCVEIPIVHRNGVREGCKNPEVFSKYDVLELAIMIQDFVIDILEK